jgi:hypothetical protein
MWLKAADSFLIRTIMGMLRMTMEYLGHHPLKQVVFIQVYYGLGITLNDFNEDGWTDISISNDFFEK